eukprot:1194195-Prorocentrum_minimum.AAC.3
MVLLCCSVTWRRAAAAADCGSWSPRSAEGVTATSGACGGMGGVSVSPRDGLGEGVGVGLHLLLEDFGELEDHVVVRLHLG